MVDGTLIADEVEARVIDVIYADDLNGIITLEMDNGEALKIYSNNSTMLESDNSCDPKPPLVLSQPRKTIN
ncbi:MAG: hypothetical protein ABFS39_04530 [Pseudomonadota bacterium]